MRSEQIPKPDPKRKKPPAAQKSERATGTSEGLPLFLKGTQAKPKKAQPGDALVQLADRIADAATSENGRGAAPAPPTSRSPDGGIPAADSGTPLDSEVRQRVGLWS